jgi:LytS/YehU family sensor histidine kinase
MIIVMMMIARVFVVMMVAYLLVMVMMGHNAMNQRKRVRKKA